MLVNLLIGAVLTFAGALATFFIIQRLVKVGRMVPEQARSCLVLALVVLVFVASACDFVLASLQPPDLNVEQRLVPMMLINAAIALVWMLWGAQKLSSDQEP